jgi:hypothetical protein
VTRLRARGATEVREVEVVPEDVHFALPGALRRDAEAVRAGGVRETGGAVPRLTGGPAGPPGG